MAKSDVIQRPEKGTELFDVSEKVFPDVQAEPGETAYTFMHTVPYEGSVGPGQPAHDDARPAQGLQDDLVLYGPGVLMASGTRGFPNVGDEAFPGHMAINNQIETFLDEGGTVYACRFASGALYGFPENLLMEGVKPFHPLDVLDSALTAWREQGVPAEHLDRLSSGCSCWTARPRSRRGAGRRRGSTRRSWSTPTLYQQYIGGRARDRRASCATCTPRTSS